MVSIVHSDSGITLFSRVFEDFCDNIDNGLNSELIGAFFTAIKGFSKQFGQNEIKQIEMSTLKFIIHERDKVMIFFLLDDNDNIEEYKKTLMVSLNTFLEIFSKEVSEYYYETHIFQKFNSILQEILKIPPEKIQPSCLNCPMGQKKDCLFNQVQKKIKEFKKI
jgi:hypothetical protein